MFVQTISQVKHQLRSIMPLMVPDYIDFNGYLGENHCPHLSFDQFPKELSEEILSNAIAEVNTNTHTALTRLQHSFEEIQLYHSFALPYSVLLMWPIEALKKRCMCNLKIYSHLISCGQNGLDDSRFHSVLNHLKSIALTKKDDSPGSCISGEELDSIIITEYQWHDFPMAS